MHYFYRIEVRGIYSTSSKVNADRGINTFQSQIVYIEVMNITILIKARIDVQSDLIVINVRPWLYACMHFMLRFHHEHVIVSTSHSTVITIVSMYDTALNSLKSILHKLSPCSAKQSPMQSKDTTLHWLYIYHQLTTWLQYTAIMYISYIAIYVDISHTTAIPIAIYRHYIDYI